MGLEQTPERVTTKAGERSVKMRITLVGAAVNLVLAILKVVLGVVGRSQALLVDGIHSLSDLVSDFLVVVAAHSSGKEADEDHPYGHARFETAGTVAVGVLLIMVAGGFAYDAAQRLMEQERLWRPHWIALVAAVVSVAAKEAVYRYTVRVGREVGSSLIQANAWHHRSDALSSLLVIGAWFGTVAGYVWVDAVAAILVAAMVGAMGWQFAWNAMRELVDTGLEPERVRELASVVTSVEGVEAEQGLRSRFMAGEVMIDAHIQVDPRLTVSEARRIGEAVRRRLKRECQEAGEVVVHIDVDSHTAPTGRRPPLRQRLLDDLSVAWRGHPEVEAASDLTLHYGGDWVDVDLELPADQVDPAELDAIAARLNEAAAHLPYLRRVRCLLASATDARVIRSDGKSIGLR